MATKKKNTSTNNKEKNNFQKSMRGVCTWSRSGVMNKKNVSVHESCGGLNFRNDGSNSVAQGSGFFEVSSELAELFLERESGG